ncbi:hypothetical protein L3Q82_023116 [Scortum barcoo]|uniref:Uncharacterized protein n=1 Tax=Scortum barcoo TaxID=214431 RepID=A0ACB8WYV7_9TELE|nr:hypothetical protein L3Q82_023116 [Scortum barcoo]
MEAWRRSEQDGRPPSIYFIPFPRNRSQQDNDDPFRVSRHSLDPQTPPQYSTSTVYCGPPPSYNELGFKPDDLPPAYTEYHVPVYPITDVVQPQSNNHSTCVEVTDRLMDSDTGVL